jgi:ketosteroid isomerase-like protein
MTESRGEIGRVVEALHASIQRNWPLGDPDKLVEEYYAEDARLLAPNLPAAIGRNQVRDVLQTWMAAGQVTLDYESVHAEVSGDLAWATGDYTVTIRPPSGEPIQDVGKYLEVFRRQADGSWRCAADIFNSRVPAP